MPHTPRPSATPRFSVVTCSYNQGHFIGATIDSVLAQQRDDMEHIVVDGGSTDNTRAVCAAYPHVQYVDAPGTSQTEALNLGFTMARGEIIAWLNSDDCYVEGVFDRVDRLLAPRGKEAMVCGGANVVAADGSYLWTLPNGRVPFLRLLFHPRIYPHNGWTVMPCQPSVFFHRVVLDELGPLDTSCRYGMDYEYWLRALSRGFRFRYVPEIFSLYRIHDSSITNKGYDTFLAEWQAIARRYYDALPAWRRGLAECWWLYGRLECLFVRRHKAARDSLARQRTFVPGEHAWPAKLGMTLRAAWTAPWFPIYLAWRRAVPPRPLAAPRRPDAEASR